MKQITVRLPAKLYEGVAQYAAISERSVNGQIVWIIKQWLVAHQGVIDAGLSVELGGLPLTVKQEAGCGDT